MMLELKSIYKKYNLEIFKDFSYIFKKNNIYFLSGKNGSGKTTLLKLINGTYLPDSGEIVFNYNLNQKNNLSFIDGNSRTFFHRLTVQQNLEYFHSLQNKQSNFNSIYEHLEYFRISSLQDKIFSSLSQGQMQIMSIIRGFSSNPRVILLDEVFSSLDVNHKKMVFDYLSDFILKEGTLVIFTSHEDHSNEMNYRELCLS